MQSKQAPSSNQKNAQGSVEDNATVLIPPNTVHKNQVYGGVGYTGANLETAGARVQEMAALTSEQETLSLAVRQNIFQS